VAGPYRTLFGDIHNHNAHGYGVGSIERSLEIARTHLDFFAFTGHSSWHDMPLTSWFGASDYYNGASFYVSSDWGRTTWEGAFYARTDNDTNYWFKSPGGGNFVFDINTHDNVMNAMGRSYNYSGTIENAVSTQRDDLTYFNQNHCY